MTTHRIGNVLKTRMALAALLLVSGSLLAQDTAPRPRQFVHTHIPVGPNGGPSAPVRSRAGGLIINPIFSSSITSNARAADIMTTINAAIAVYQATYSNPITVTIQFNNVNTGLGASSTFTGTFPYTDYRAALIAKATTADDMTALGQVPNQTNNPVNNDPNMTIATALARALGLTGGQENPPQGQPDSSIDLNISLMNILATDNNSQKYSLAATVEHEIDEALGMGSQLDSGTTGGIYPEDLFRFDGSGSRSFTTSKTATSFFSIDGTTKLAQFNQDSSGDFGDWFSVNGGQIPQVQDAFGSPGDHEVLGVELTVLDVIGYTRGAGGTGSGGGGPNVPPVISSPASCTPNPASVGIPAALSVGATDANNDSLTVTWDFGDGSNGSGKTVMHTYGTPGTYNATATVSDGNGGTVTSSVVVTAVVTFTQVSTFRQKFSLNFKTGRDGLDVTLESDAFFNSADGTTVSIIVGDMAAGKAVTVDSGTLFRNKATGSVGKFTLNTRNGTLRYAATKGSFQDLLAPFGAVNDDVSQTVSIPIFIFFNNGIYGDTYDFFYVGRFGRNGTGK